MAESPEAASSVLTDGEITIIDTVSIVSASLSLCGSLMICATYFILHCMGPEGGVTHMNLRLLLFLSISDIMSDAMVIVGTQVRYGDPGCEVVALLETYTDLVPILWTAAMSSALWYNVTRDPHKDPRGEVYVVRYCIFCFGLPLLTAMLGLALDIYGQDGATPGCWIKDSKLRLLFFYCPLWIVVVFNSLMYRAVLLKFRKRDKDTHELAPSETRNSKAPQLKYYPAVLVLTWFFGTLNRVLEVFGVTYFSILVLQEGFGRSQGLWNALVYGLDPVQDFRSVIVQNLCGRRGSVDGRAAESAAGVLPLSVVGPLGESRSMSEVDSAAVRPLAGVPLRAPAQQPSGPDGGEI